MNIYEGLGLQNLKNSNLFIQLLPPKFCIV